MSYASEYDLYSPHCQCILSLLLEWMGKPLSTGAVFTVLLDRLSAKHVVCCVVFLRCLWQSSAILYLTIILSIGIASLYFWAMFYFPLYLTLSVHAQQGL